MSGPELLGRDGEREAIRRLVDTARLGVSRTLVITGEPGVGKTALLEDALADLEDMRVLRADSRCDGFNIGLNQGRIAGAGVADHLHQHIVPRWASDANFFPIIAETKALPVLLGDTRAALAAAWPR